MQQSFTGGLDSKQTDSGLCRKRKSEQIKSGLEKGKERGVAHTHTKKRTIFKITCNVCQIDNVKCSNQLTILFENGVFNTSHRHYDNLARAIGEYKDRE